MNNKKMLNKLYKVFYKHSGDNGFSFSPDEIGEYFSSLEDYYERLYKLSQPNTLEWQDVSAARDYKNRIVDAVEEMKNNENLKSFVKKNNGLLTKITQGAEEMYDSIRQKKPTDTTIEIEIATEVFKKLLAIEKKEMSLFPRSVQALKTIKSQINYQWDHFDYDLLVCLEDSDRLMALVIAETEPEFQKQLNAMIKDIKKVHNRISKNVIEHYDELNKIDKEIHNDKTFCRVNIDDLKKDYPIEEDIEAE